MTSTPAQKKIDALHRVLSSPEQVSAGVIQEREILGYTLNNIVGYSSKESMETIAESKANKLGRPVVVFEARTMFLAKHCYAVYKGNSRNTKKPVIKGNYSFAKPNLLNNLVN